MCPENKADRRGCTSRDLLFVPRHFGRVLRVALVVLLILTLASPGYADRATAAYRRGQHAEQQNDRDAAFQAYKEAVDIKPRNARYLAAYLRLRFYAATDHVHAGQLLRDSGKLEEAMAEFQKAIEIDRTSFLAQQELRRTSRMIQAQEAHAAHVHASPESPLAKMAEQAAGPIELQAFSSTPINLRLTAEADAIYKIVGKLAGLNVLVDPDFRAPRINVELNDVTVRDALDMVALQSKTFWQPVSSNTIFVASDTAGKRKDIQDNVMKTFYLENVATPTELADAANILKGILDLSHIQLNPTQNAIILRGTPDQMVLAEKLLGDIDKPKPEVVIDIAVLQVSRDRIRTLGSTPPTSTSIALAPGAGSTTGSGNQLTLNSLAGLNATNFLVSIPGASLTALMSDGHTKIIQNPQIRAQDNQKATLKIGDRVPVATGSFQPGVGGGSINPLVNTQFQYLDVGVNIDITPHIHSGNEVTLKMVLEISSVTGTQNIGGISQPVIGQRRIEHETRLQDGDVNLVGGILEESETQSLSGYPWLTRIPILKYLFGQDDKQRRENEIVFAITPHIIRAQELTDQNLRMVDVGKGNAIEIRRTDTPVSAAPAPEGKDRPQQPKPTGHAQPGPARPKPPLPSPQPQASADVCPLGQHRVGEEQGIVVCGFD
jgi:general secretion pathway protein D